MEVAEQEALGIGVVEKVFPLWPPDQLDIMHCYMMWNSPRMPSLKMGAMRSVWEVVLVGLFIYMLCLMKWYRCLW